LKKSPTGSASARGPLKNNSTITASESQRQQMKRLIELSVFKCETGIFSQDRGLREVNFFYEH
jgi:hypothetical protein